MDPRVEGSDLAVADDELLITRVFDAPAALVFRVWAEREHMVRWLGPKGFVCTQLTMDFRPGGAWRACIESPEYGVNWMGGEYREIVPGRRIVYTFAWGEPAGLASVVTVDFRALGDGRTEQRFHQAPFADVDSRDSHVGGWNSSFDREQAYAEALAREAAR